MALPFGSPVDAHANADAVDAPTGYPNCFPTAHGSLTAFGRSKLSITLRHSFSSTRWALTNFGRYLTILALLLSILIFAFTGNATGKRGFSVGIDASGWMYRACCLCGSTESPELVVLFASVGKIIRGNEHWLNEFLQAQLNGFGFEWIDAPGEAEATPCCDDSQRDSLRVDAILTDDSDSFVFGCKRSEDNANYEASRYSAFDIATMLGLSRDDLVLGWTTWIAASPSPWVFARAGLGKQLISGLEGQSHAGLNDFPDLEVINLYLHPIVVEHTSTRPLIYVPPRLDVLARFAEDHFGWGDSVGILAHFADHLFAGLVVRDLLRLMLDPRPHHPHFGSPVYYWATRSCAGCRGSCRSVARTDLPKVRVWVPKSMVEYVYPEIVLVYISAQSKDRPKPPEPRKQRPQQGKIEAYRPYTAASSSFITTGDPEGHAILRRNEQSGSSSLEVNCSLVRPEKRYTAMSVTFRGQEILELITDSEGEY
ncbi:hypothetical protein B0H14DRAFT_2805527 [Mycena olivaceomarginata]|nr:hypothetical protein B0H14DRAFT_2805527 [Mycena olivaceomarginata]